MARVLVMCVVYPPDRVSTANLAAGLVCQLRRYGHDVAILTTVPHYNPPPHESNQRRFMLRRPITTTVEGGSTVVRIYIPQKRHRVALRAFDFAVWHLLALIAAVRRFRDRDVVLVISPPLTLAVVAFALRALSKARVIYNVQEIWPDVPRDLGVIKSKTLVQLLSSLERSVYRHSDRVVAIGDRFAELVRSRGGRSVVTIPNFVDTSWITPGEKDNKLAERWGVVNRRVILYAGNLGLTQDFELLLEAAAALRHEGVVLVIVGGGALRESLVARVEGLANVQLHEYVPADHVRDLYALSDIVAVPLKRGHDRTTTPSKIYSAMAAGRPVVACAGYDTDLAEEIRRARAGLVVEPGDVDGFVAAVRSLFDASSTVGWSPADALAASLGRTPDVVGERYAAVVDELTRSQPGSLPGYGRRWSG